MGSRSEKFPSQGCFTRGSGQAILKVMRPFGPSACLLFLPTYISLLVPVSNRTTLQLKKLFVLYRSCTSSFSSTTVVHAQLYE